MGSKSVKAERERERGEKAARWNVEREEEDACYYGNMVDVTVYRAKKRKK